MKPTNSKPTTERKENAMYAHTQLRLRLANERIAQAHRDAAASRLAFAARDLDRLTLRRRLGRSIIRIGERLASERALEAARAR
jgi:hypothetical protein